MAWQWIEYSRKDNAKRALETGGFIEGIDYEVSLISEGMALGGRRSEKIMLSIDCFKMLGMMAKTAQGRRIREYFINCEKALREAQVSQTPKLGAYTRRLNDLNDNLKCPKGYWTIMEQSSHLLATVEKNYEVKELQLLDGSIGNRWGRFRKTQPWVGEAKKAVYTFSDHRGTVQINSYPFVELPHYKVFEQDVYVPKYLPTYLEQRYRALAKNNY